MSEPVTHATKVLAALEDQTQALNAIAEELKEIREIFCSFTTDGLPLARQVPDNQLLASLVASLVCLLRDLPLSGGEVGSRIAVAQVMGKRLIQEHDHFNMQTQTAQLDELANR